MSLFDGLLLVSASVHAAAAVFYGSMHRATRRDEHRAIARFSGAFSVYLLAEVLLEVSTHPAGWAAISILMWVVGNLSVAGLAELCAVLAGEPPAAQEKWYGILVGLWLVAFGIAVGLTGDLTAALDGYQMPAGAVTVVQSTVVFGLLGRAVLRLARAARERPELRSIVTGIGLAVSFGLIDELMRWRSGPRVHLAEHGALLVVGAATVALADRQAQSVFELTARSRALGEAHEALASTRQARGRREPLAALGELSAVVAHEVRNPLAIVKNAVSSLRRPALDPTDRATLLEIVGEEAGRLSRLVRDLLAFARPRATIPAEVDVRQLVHRAVRDATRGSTQAIARIEVEIEDVTSLEGDAELLRLALSNVIENALQASEDVGKVRIVCRPVARDVEIAVVDAGRGMSEDIVKKARDPFFTTRPTGTGLGLAIVDRVLCGHGGALEIESEMGTGSTVRLRLPRELGMRATPGGGLEATS